MAMAWRLKWWWLQQKRRFTICWVLTGDQCWHGFSHTRDELLLWLGQCDLDAQIELHKALGEQIEELKVFRESRIR